MVTDIVCHPFSKTLDPPLFCHIFLVSLITAVPTGPFELCLMSGDEKLYLKNESFDLFLVLPLRLHQKGLHVL